MDQASRDVFRRAIARSHAPITKSAFVLDSCAGAKVLDVGCLDHSGAKAIAAGPNWLHAQVRDVARSLIGLDFVAKDVEMMNQLGYSIIVGNAEEFQLNEQFEVVLAADVVEHLSNLGLFLERAREHLVERGRLVLTTPNPFALGHFAHALIRGEIAVNDEHTVWLDPLVLFELLGRHGFVVQTFKWLTADKVSAGGRNAIDALGKPLVRFRPVLHRNYGVVAAPS